MICIGICDDDLSYIKIIKKMVEKFMNQTEILYQIETFTSGEELLAYKELIQLLLLDISMKGIDGIETGMQIYFKNKNTEIIYITNFHQYCNRAINYAHAFAYLKKPLKEDDLQEQLSQAIELIIEQNEQKISIKFQNVSEEKKYSDSVEYKIKEFIIADILYFEYDKLGRKVQLISNDKRYILSRVTMKEIVEKMEPYGFAICCKGILVNLSHVAGIKGYTIFLDNENEIPLSQKRSSYFREKMNQFVQKSI